MYKGRDDESLMSLYANGDERAFNELYSRYKTRVYGFFTKKVGLQMAEELFQKTFLNLHRSRINYNAKYPFSVWIFTICRNLHLDHLRSEKRLPEFTDMDVEKIEAKNEKQLANYGDKIEHAMSSLTKTQRQVLNLRFEQGLDFEEIALKLQTSNSNIRQILSRAVRSIKEKWKGA